MAKEIEARKPGSFLELTDIRSLRSEAEASKPVFVGGIRFNQGKNLLLIGEAGNNLITSPVIVEENRDFLVNVQETGRLITLNTFQEVNIRQVELAAVEVPRPESVYKHPPLSLNFPVRNPDNDQREELSLGEKDLLNIFTGESGGIAVFSGQGFPEETGLLVERNTSEGKKALILFMHPTIEDTSVLDSVNGLATFLGMINKELAVDTDIELQKKALEIISKYEDKGKVDFGSQSVRKQIFQLQVIAHARRAEKGETAQTKTVKKLVPGTKRTIIGTHKHPPRDYQSIVDGKIDSVLIDANRTSQDKKVKEPPKKEEINFYTDKGRIYFKNFKDENGHNAKVDFLNKAITWLGNVSSPQELHDVEILLTHFLDNINSYSIKVRKKEELKTHLRTRLELTISEKKQEFNQSQL